MSKVARQAPVELPPELIQMILTTFLNQSLDSSVEERLGRLTTLRAVRKGEARTCRAALCLITMELMMKRREEWRATIVHPMCQFFNSATSDQDTRSWAIFLELISGTDAKKGFSALKLIADQHKEDERRTARVVATLPPIPNNIMGAFTNVVQNFQAMLDGGDDAHD